MVEMCRHVDHSLKLSVASINEKTPFLALLNCLVSWVESVPLYMTTISILGIGSEGANIDTWPF